MGSCSRITLPRSPQTGPCGSACGGRALELRCHGQLLGYSGSDMNEETKTLTREQGAQAAEALTRGIEKVVTAARDSGRYLSDAAAGDFVDELASFVRSRPLISLLYGVGIGILIGAAWAKR